MGSARSGPGSTPPSFGLLLLYYMTDTLGIGAAAAGIGIRICGALLPALLMLSSVPMLRRYDLDRARSQQMYARGERG